MDIQILGVVLVVLCFTIETVNSHGRLVEPPSRASMWRYGYDTPEDWADNQQFCGGYTHQWQKNGGKCGICGDPYDGERTHEAGGKYANGIIVRRYQPGHVILVIVQLTAAHLGYFEFRICPNNNPKKRATQNCLDRRVLQLADDSGTKYHITDSTPKNYEILLKLPKDISCSQCVLQWKYHSGNSWGQEGNEPGCLGCGAQEEFYGCADVAIGNNTLFDPLYYEMLEIERQKNLTESAKAATSDPLSTRESSVNTGGAEVVTLTPTQMQFVDLGPHLPPPGPHPHAGLASLVQLPEDAEREKDEGWVMDFLNEMWGVMFNTIQSNLRTLGGVFSNATIPKPPSFQNQFPDFFLEEKTAAQHSSRETKILEQLYATTESTFIPPGYLRGNTVGASDSKESRPQRRRLKRRRKLRMKNPSLKFRKPKAEKKKTPIRLSWTEELAKALAPKHHAAVSDSDEKGFLGVGTTHASVNGALKLKNSDGK